MDDWDSEVLAAESLEDFEELKAKLPQGHVFVRQMWNKAVEQARQYGFAYDGQTKTFASVQPQEQTA